jgi:Flp pilus assembly protein TadD
VGALLYGVVFLVASPDEAPPAEPAEPIVISYDADLLEPPQPEVAVAGIADPIVDRRSHALALALRGRSNMLAGRTKLALSQFDEALEYNPQNRLALAQLGEWHLEHGRAAKAAEHLHGALRVEPRDSRVHLLLGRAYDRLGRPGRAQYHYRAADKHGHPEAAKKIGG